MRGKSKRCYPLTQFSLLPRRGRKANNEKMKYFIVILLQTIVFQGLCVVGRSEPVACPYISKKYNATDRFETKGPLGIYAEVSGLVFSPKQRAPSGEPVIFAMSDGGAGTRIGAWDSQTGKRLMTLKLNSSVVKNLDWEAMTIGSCGNTESNSTLSTSTGSNSTGSNSTCLYVADTGDNTARATGGRRSMRGSQPARIIKIKEPQLDAYQDADFIPNSDVVVLNIYYTHSSSPVDFVDVETVFLDHVGWGGGSKGDIYLISKWGGNRAKSLTRLYKIPSSAWPDGYDGQKGEYLPTVVGNYDYKTDSNGSVKDGQLLGKVWTGGEMSFDGTMIGLVTTRESALFLRCPGESVAEALAAQNAETHYCFKWDQPTGRTQVESFAFDADGKKSLAIPEGKNPRMGWTEYEYDLSQAKRICSVPSSPPSKVPTPTPTRSITPTITDTPTEMIAAATPSPTPTATTDIPGEMTAVPTIDPTEAVTAEDSKIGDQETTESPNSITEDDGPRTIVPTTVETPDSSGLRYDDDLYIPPDQLDRASTLSMLKPFSAANSMDDIGNEGFIAILAIAGVLCHLVGFGLVMYVLNKRPRIISKKPYVCVVDCSFDGNSNHSEESPGTGGCTESENVDIDDQVVVAAVEYTDGDKDDSSLEDIELSLGTKEDAIISDDDIKPSSYEESHKEAIVIETSTSCGSSAWDESNEDTELSIRNTPQVSSASSILGDSSQEYEPSGELKSIVAISVNRDESRGETIAVVAVESSANNPQDESCEGIEMSVCYTPLQTSAASYSPRKKSTSSLFGAYSRGCKSMREVKSSTHNPTRCATAPRELKWSLHDSPRASAREMCISSCTSSISEYSTTSDMNTDPNLHSMLPTRHRQRTTFSRINMAGVFEECSCSLIRVKKCETPIACSVCHKRNSTKGCPCEMCYGVVCEYCWSNFKHFH